MNIEMALISRRYILNLDRVKLSMEIFFFLSFLIVSFFTSFQDLPLFLSKTHTKKPQILCFAYFYLWQRFGGFLECDVDRKMEINLCYILWLIKS